jgi:hypothetical protein
LKNPAYARALIERRRAGDHPWKVHVIYGNDWYIGEDLVRLAVKPRAALGLSWACVAGLRVILLDRATPDEDPDQEDGYREFHYVAAEIARCAAGVEMHSPYPFYAHQDGPGIADVGQLAYAASLPRLSEWIRGRRRQWPKWWSDELDEIYGKNAQRWREEVAASVLA